MGLNPEHIYFLTLYRKSTPIPDTKIVCRPYIIGETNNVIVYFYGSIYMCMYFYMYSMLFFLSIKRCVEVIGNLEY